MSISAELGELKEVALDQGTIRYRERGSGPAIVFVHGLLVNGDLWRKVVPELAGEARCITADWPLGSHEVALNADTDLRPPGVAKLIAEFLTALNLENVTLVGNDTGGAFCQLVIADYPERVNRLVLTNCDCYENFPPLMLRALPWLARLPGFAFLMMQSLRPGLSSKILFGLVSKRPIETEIKESYMRPATSDGAVRRDLTKFLKGISSRYTLAAANRFGDFNGPVLVAWAPEDRLFPWRYAEKLAAAFPNSQLERVDDSRTFAPEDQPQRLAELIAAFMREHVGARLAAPDSTAPLRKEPP